jgi:NAD(P)-dependent dehydrogenase (short-subunit alcohol dehydrogenase family)
MILTTQDAPAARAFAADPRVGDLSQRGPATPDHVIWTKPTPQLGLDVDAYVEGYRRYFETESAHARAAVTMLDPAPRVVLDPRLGMLAAGGTPQAAVAVRDIYDHTIEVISAAERLGGYRPITRSEQFDVEYWDLEQAKVRRATTAGTHRGQVVLITGAAGGIGHACAAAFLREGAAVVGLDLASDVGSAFTGDAWLGVRCDVTEPDQVERAIDAAVPRFGGLDVLVLNAGIFPAARAVAELDGEVWRRTMSVNVDAALELLRRTHPLLRLAPQGGRVVVIGSKNVAAPGPGAAAYSASKAALTQLARVTALEWAADGIRVNIVHPDAVFDTGIWTPEVLAERAAHYGVSVDEYKRRNLLGAEIRSTDVAELCVTVAGPAFAKTTGAQIPIDGGNERVI